MLCGSIHSLLGTKEHIMENGQLWGWVGGGIGALCGILGGVIGTYFSIKNTRGPRERAFAVRASIVCWIFVLVFVGAMFLIPTWHKHLLWIPYTILLIVGIRICNKKFAQIRNEESGRDA